MRVVVHGRQPHPGLGESRGLQPHRLEPGDGAFTWHGESPAERQRPRDGVHIRGHPVNLALQAVQGCACGGLRSAGADLDTCRHAPNLEVDLDQRRTFRAADGADA
ncbi:hypothetical protein GCM10009679_47070 [Saccharothrix algeriensis]|uniref:Uncharacterized protein n=1 Tax=Catellatospora bangladeshensis TaxID=310355 RepID=A0A8J3JPN4_9ACTN|nr:hypothetical protein Cba03nite_59950 [Catellatospora bangladeshensis]